MPVLDNPNIRSVMMYILANTLGRNIWDGQVFAAYVFMVTGSSNTMVGNLAGVSGMTVVCLGPLSGYLADRMDRLTILKRISLVGATACILMSIVIINGAYNPLLLMMLLWGCFQAFTGPAMDSYLADVTAAGERSEVFSYQTMIRQMAGAIGPVLTIVIFSTRGNDWDISTLKLVIVVGLCVNLVAMLLLYSLKGGEVTHNALAALPPLSLSQPQTQTQSGVVYNPVAQAEEDGLLEQEPDQEEGGNTVGETTSPSSSSVSSSPLKSEAPIDGPPSKSTGTGADADADDAENCSCVALKDINYVAAMIAFSDIITGLASGMTVKFFPIFFMEVLNMDPIAVNVLFLLCPILSGSLTWINTKYVSKYFGRIPTVVSWKFLGTSLLLSISYMAQFGAQYAVAVGTIFIIRTGVMNSSKPLTKSIINDIVPKHQRGRWNSLESINAATWSGSAFVGGMLVDRYGFVMNFAATACLQLVATLPLLAIAKYVQSEGQASGSVGSTSDRKGAVGVEMSVMTERVNERVGVSPALP